MPEAGVAFVPGTRADGGLVAPAELPGSPRIALPGTVQIFLDVPLDDLPGGASGALGKAEASLGVVEVDLVGGRVLYNGQRLVSEHEAAWVARCEAAREPDDRQ